MTLLILLPMQEELDLFIQYCTRHGLLAAESSVGRLPVVRLLPLEWIAARGGNGKAQFGIQAQHLLDAGSGWDHVLCVGAAGALHDELKIGDVVVATVTVEHDYRNRFGTRPTPTFEGSPAALSQLRRVASSLPGFRVHFGAIASGDEDIVDETRKRELREATGALAVAWEGAGGGRASRFSGIPFLEIRGITDAAGSSAALDFRNNLATAIHHAAAVVFAWRNRVSASPII